MTAPEPGPTAPEAGAEPQPEPKAKVLELPDLPPAVLSDEQLSNAIVYLLSPRETEEKGPADEAFGEISHPRKRAFLIAYALCGSKTRAARAAGVTRNAFYSAPWYEDAPFQAAVAKAERMAVDIMEDEAHRRAVEGVVKPTGWYKGEPGGYIREFSDVLLIFKLKGALPDKYKDRMELKGSLANLDLNQLNDGQLARIAAGEHPLAVLASGRAALEAGVGIVQEQKASIDETG